LLFEVCTGPGSVVGKELKDDLAPLTKEAQVKHPALIEDLKRRYNYCAKMAP
jgi:hypothetical protein